MSVNHDIREQAAAAAERANTQDMAAAGYAAEEAIFDSLVADPSIIRRVVKGPRTADERRAALSGEATLAATGRPSQNTSPGAKRKLADLSDDDLRRLSDQLVDEQIKRMSNETHEAIDEADWPSDPDWLSEDGDQ